MQKQAKVWKKKAVEALKAFAKRVGYPEVQKINTRTAHKHHKKVKAFAKKAPANAHQIAQIKAHDLHPNPEQLTFLEARELLGDFFYRQREAGKKPKVWSDKAVEALKRFAKRVGYPDVEAITPENAAEYQKRVREFVAQKPATPHQVAQIKALKLHPNPEKLSLLEARALLSKHARNRQKKAA